MTGSWFYHINALQNTENWRFCRTTRVRWSETQGQSTGGMLMTCIDILHVLKVLWDTLQENIHYLVLWPESGQHFKLVYIFFPFAWFWTERHLQSERAARKATVLQMATMYTALGGTLLNVGVTLNSQGNQIIANGSFIGAGRFPFLCHKINSVLNNICSPFNIPYFFKSNHIVVVHRLLELTDLKHTM